MRQMNLSFPPHAPIFNETVTFEKGKVDIGSERQERMEVDDKERNHDEDEDDNQEQTTPTAFSFSFPPQKSPLPMTTANPSRTTPVRRRSGAPTSIPNFPSATEHREPPVHYSPSPSRSPAASSPYQSPAVTPMKLPSSRVPFMPIQSPPSAGQSPWHALAATSGAPTPSLDGPGAGKGKGSPHLGYPFENLNIGGSWSGANLWGEGAQGRRASLEPAVVPSMSAPPKSTSMSGAVHGGINKEALARYRAAMGKTAAKEVPHTMEVDPPPVPTKTPLPAALARRRGSLPKNAIAMANNSLSPSTTHPTKAPSPLASSTTPLVLAPNKIKPLAPSAIPPMLSKPATLILDLRPPSAHHGARLPDSHSLSVPSTLLRRPAFTTAKMTQMLSTVSSAAVGRWRETTDIILVDVDSSSASQGSIMDGVANKFASEGYRGCLWYIKGGFAAVVATPGIEIISDDGEEEDAADPKPVAMKLNASGMMVGRLDKLAFQQASTGGQRQPRPTGLRMPSSASMSMGQSTGGYKTPGGNIRPDPFAAPASSHREGPNPLSDLSISRPYASSSPSGSRTSHTASAHSGAGSIRLQPANPFFDNIRQNLELSHGGITERIPLGVPSEVISRANELPNWLGELVSMSEQDAADSLAGQFYNIELGEQQRLQGVMDWHSQGSGAVWRDVGNKHGPSKSGQKDFDAKEVDRLANWGAGTQGLGEDYFPFSITAGVERGTKNRYKNIWPYDFSRVRLGSPTDDDSDYINASYVQPKGTYRRYIATQGPMDATYRDFWTLIWEQGVRVIVMLTKQHEGGSLKCGNYWCNQNYGSLQLQLVSQTGGEDVLPQASQTSGFDFGSAAAPSSSTPRDSGETIPNIRRTFLLSHKDHPGETRKIVQIQCTAWPDFDVPESPEVLLGLMRDVDVSQEETCGAAVDEGTRAEQPPVLVHCSAGVGRTGSFIVVDAIADALRREHRRSSAAELESLHGSGTSTALPQQGRSSNSILGSSFGPSSSNLSVNHNTLAPGSGDSGRSMASIPSLSQSTNTGTSVDSLPTIFSTSPGAISSPIPAPKNSEQERKDSMELDPLPEEPVEEWMAGERFTRHRGSSVSQASEDYPASERRPSLSSPYGSSEYMGVDEDAPRPITMSSQRHRSPSPISEMEGPSPIAHVLEGMRVQRMSLVQSLRQYLFVHRAIIHYYLSMLDENSTNPDLSAPSRESTASLQYSTDDEGHVKRRASPTELELNSEKQGRANATGLSKRQSFKKMRAGVEGKGSPASPGKVRSRSKLVPPNQDEGAGAGASV